MKLKTAILAFASSVLFASCTSSKVFVTNTKRFKILPPSCFEKEIDGMYMLTASFGESSFSSPVYLQVNKDEFSLLMISDFGTTLAELYYDGKKCTLESSVLPKKLKPEYLVADFEYAFGDIVQIEEGLREAGLAFSVISEFGSLYSPDVPAPSHQFRYINDGNKVISQIDISEDGTIIIENFLRKYKYTLTEVAE